MNIGELLATIGSENIKFQMLEVAMTNISTGKKCSKITFETNALNATNVACNSGPVGMIVWLPRDKYNAIVAELKK